jgi:nucleotide-binding universal stress UspA family protein
VFATVLCILRRRGLRKFEAGCEIPRNSLALFGLNLDDFSGIGCAQISGVGFCGRFVMKILLAIDGSSCSDAAVEEVARRPWPEGSLVKVLIAVETPMPPTAETWALPVNYFQELDAALRKQGENIVNRALQRLKSNKTFSADAVLVPGPPRPVILDEAESWGANLIVLGSHGYSAWKRFLLGSVSQAVVSHAKCSVEVVRCPPPEAGKSPNK